MRSELRGRSETARSAARGEASAPRRFGSRAALVALLVAQPALQVATASDKLPALGAPIGATSVSGLSSGAYMAGQIQLAHAKDVVGAGLVAGGPFACAESAAGRLVPYWPTAVAQNAQKALHGCMLVDWGTPDPVELADRAKELASAGEIDSLADLAGDKIYLYSGNADHTVTRPVVEAAKALYRELGVPEKNIALVEGEGGHGFLTEAAGEACALTDKPYVNDCDYDQAKAILQWIYGPLAAPSAASGGRFIIFDQSAYADPGDGLALHRHAPRAFGQPARAFARRRVVHRVVLVGLGLVVQRELDVLDGSVLGLVGLALDEARYLLKATTLHGNLPEPLRLAHLIAGGVVTGKSRGRA